MIYLDVLFLMNFLMDYLLLSLTAAFRKVRVKRWRLMLGAFLGSLYVLFFFSLSLTFLYSFVAKFLFSLMLVALVFGVRDVRRFLRFIGTFYMVSFLVGGGVFAFYWFFQSQVAVLYRLEFLRGVSLTGLSMFVVLLVGFPLSWLFARTTYRSLDNQRLVHEQLVQIEVNVFNEAHRCVGFLDTGNQLYDPLTRTPVIVMEADCLPFLPPALNDIILRGVSLNTWEEEVKRLSDEWVSRLRLIPFRTASQAQEGWLVAFRPDRLTLWLNEEPLHTRRVLVGLTATTLSSDGTYHSILHPSLVNRTAS